MYKFIAIALAVTLNDYVMAHNATVAYATLFIVLPHIQVVLKVSDFVIIITIDAFFVDIGLKFMLCPVEKLL